ncbi:MAG: hypothetical protein R2779_04780 [Crocinitomicaceae bacterium]
MLRMMLLGADLLTALNSDVPISIRKNQRKTNCHFEAETPIEWCEDAYF